MSQNTRDCITAVSTIFTFESPAYQQACNSIYVNRSTMDSYHNRNDRGNTNYIKFKSDLERLQYLMGKFNVNPSSG
jgi:hypothetical protein